MRVLLLLLAALSAGCSGSPGSSGSPVPTPAHKNPAVQSAIEQWMRQTTWPNGSKPSFVRWGIDHKWTKSESGRMAAMGWERWGKRDKGPTPYIIYGQEVFFADYEWCEKGLPRRSRRGHFNPDGPNVRGEAYLFLFDESEPPLMVAAISLESSYGWDWPGLWTAPRMIQHPEFPEKLRD